MKLFTTQAFWVFPAENIEEGMANWDAPVGELIQIAFATWPFVAEVALLRFIRL